MDYIYIDSDSYIDTGIILYENKYLSGFIFQQSTIINGMYLQFTDTINGHFYPQCIAPMDKNVTGIELCHKLSEYGCNPTEFPVLFKSLVNLMVDNFTLPTDPCLFDTINMSKILQEIDLDNYILLLE